MSASTTDPPHLVASLLERVLSVDITGCSIRGDLEEEFRLSFAVSPLRSSVVGGPADREYQEMVTGP